MKAGDRTDAGDDDAGKTAQLDDTHRRRLNGQWLEAESALVYARGEFKSAAADVISRIKAGEDLPKPELDREWNARRRFFEARELFERLSRLQKASRKDRPIGERE